MKFFSKKCMNMVISPDYQMETIQKKFCNDHYILPTNASPRSIVAEQARLDAETDTHGRVKLLERQQALAVTVVILQEQILIIALEDAVIKLYNGVIIEFPPLTLDQRDSRTETLVERSE